MIKRGLPVFLSFVVLASVLTFPVSAAEFENSSFFDVLNYSSLTDYDMVVSSGDVITFDVPDTSFYNIDIVISCDLTNLSVSCNGHDLSVVQISSSSNRKLYRIFGSLKGYIYNKLSLTLNFSSGSFLVFHSFVASTLATNSYDIPVQFEISSPVFDGTISHEAGSDITYKILNPVTDAANNYFYCYINSPAWYKYDFLDFQFLFDCSDISSISAQIGSSSLPLEISKISNSSFPGQFFVSIRIDLRGLDRSSFATGDYPMVCVSGSGRLDYTWSIACLNGSGIVLSNVPDYLSFHLKRIFNSIKTGFSDVLKGISDFQSHWTKYMDDWVTNICNNIGNFDDHFIQYTKKVKEWISELTSSISSEFSSLKTSLSAWIQDQTSSISFEFLHLKNSLSSWIKEQTDSLIAVIKGDSSVGDQFQSDVGQKKDDVGQMIDVMGSVSKPDLGSFDMSGTGLIDQNMMLTSMSGLSAVIKHPIFLPIITLSLTLATAAYVLFGKR